MKLIGISGLTCSGKSTLINLIDKPCIKIDLGNIIRDTFAKNNVNEISIFEFTIASHNIYGKSWSLCKALDQIPNSYNGLVIISGIRFLSQLNILQRIDNNYKLIFLEAKNDKRLERYLQRKRSDLTVSVKGFEYKEKIELENYDVPEIKKRSHIMLKNNFDIIDLKNELSNLKIF